jgi:hypothetical protein
MRPRKAVHNSSEAECIHQDVVRQHLASKWVFTTPQLYVHVRTRVHVLIHTAIQTKIPLVLDL